MQPVRSRPFTKGLHQSELLYALDNIKHHSSQITRALLRAGLNPVLIHEFLELQIDACWKVNRFLNKPKGIKLTIEEQISLNNGAFIQNEIALTSASILSALIDTELTTKDLIYEEPLGDDAIQHLKQTIIDAQLEFQIIIEFMQSQIETFIEFNTHNREKFSKEEQDRNERKIEQIIFFLKALS